MLLDLSIDSLEIICNYLDPRDIFHLWLTCQALLSQLQTSKIYQILYVKLFHGNPIGLNWINRFKSRTSPTKLYTWGSTDLGRLGYLIKDVPGDKLTSNRNVSKPQNLSNFNGIVIRDLKSNGFSFQILTNQGVFFTGNDYRRYHELTAPGPTSKDFQQTLELSAPVGVFPPIRGRRGGGRIISPGHQLHLPTNLNLTKPPNDIPELREFNSNQNPSKNIESSFVTKITIPTDYLITIESGRQHMVILDRNNNIYTLDTGNTSYRAIKLIFSHVETPYVSKIKCGWNLSSYYGNNELVVWYSREPLTADDIKNDRYESKANYWIVPDVNNEIIDWYLGNGFIVLVKTSGIYGRTVDTLHYFHNIEGYSVLEDFYLLQSFNNWLDNYNEQIFNDKNPKPSCFTKIVGCYNNFAIFTNNQKIILGNRELVDPDIESSLELVDLDDIVELEMGDYHYLALDSQGVLYSWGIESNDCGCLGLGNNETKIKEGRNYKVTVPQIVEGKWLVITASGWHSGGIQLDDEK